MNLSQSYDQKYTRHPLHADAKRKDMFNSWRESQFRYSKQDSETQAAIDAVLFWGARGMHSFPVEPPSDREFSLAYVARAKLRD